MLNNVSGFSRKRHETAEGLEFTFVLDHMAYYLLTELLLLTLRGVKQVMRQQCPLDFCGQPIRLGHADWFHPLAFVRWRVDIGATGD